MPERDQRTEALADGGCLCGAVRYQAVRPLREVVACQCGQCLRSHGHHAAYTAVAKSALTFLEQRGLAWYASSETARRGFCRDCGSSLFWDPGDRDYVAIAAGSLDQPSGLKLVAHVFTASKADYYEITDGLEQSPAGGGYQA